MKKKDYSYEGNLEIEKELWGKGFEYVAGVDECGRGPWAGNVVAGCVIMPKDFKIERLTDSKKISKKEHSFFAEEVKKHAIAYGIGIATVEEIDTLNIKQASRLAMKRAVEEVLKKIEKIDYLLVDGNEIVEFDIPQKSVIKGDYCSHSISAAAILAKVYRDEYMAKLDKEYGYVYGWKENAGYQTKAHIEAVKEHGLTPHHRKSWKTTALFEN